MLSFQAQNEQFQPIEIVSTTNSKSAKKSKKNSPFGPNETTKVTLWVTNNFHYSANLCSHLK